MSAKKWIFYSNGPRDLRVGEFLRDSPKGAGVIVLTANGKEKYVANSKITSEGESNV